MKKIITISGNLGSGKSTVGNMLSNYFDYEILAIGDLVRNIAKKKGMTINEFNEYIKDKPEYDKIIDDQITQEGTDKDKLIFISRTAWYFVPESFKVYLYVNEIEGAKRILSDSIRINEKYYNQKEAIEKINKRFENSRNRYLKNYGIDITKIENYDLYLDTTDKSIDEVFNIIKEEYLKYLNTKVLIKEDLK